jgi:hypothetical protein
MEENDYFDEIIDANDPVKQLIKQMKVIRK